MKDEHDDIRRRLKKKKLIFYSLAGLFFIASFILEPATQLTSPFAPFIFLIFFILILSFYSCFLLGLIYGAAQGNTEKKPGPFLRKAQLLLLATIVADLSSCFLAGYQVNSMFSVLNANSSVSPKWFVAPTRWLPTIEFLMFFSFATYFILQIWLFVMIAKHGRCLTQVTFDLKTCFRSIRNLNNSIRNKWFKKGD